ncbi:MAG: hypothetical protein RBG13Loki_2915 [Promethearchaeota archaeon CR_4]|nr:MAG: hypothetical protein RBG13Loki_2915 [Candidatus Lokiarchaeota archaeon CR_4]
MSLAQFLSNRKSETNNFNASIERINSMFNSSIAQCQQKIQSLEAKVTSLEQIVTVTPGEDPLKKIQQNQKVVKENMESLRAALLAELKELLSRRPLIQ